MKFWNVVIKIGATAAAKITKKFINEHFALFVKAKKREIAQDKPVSSKMHLVVRHSVENNYQSRPHSRENMQQHGKWL